MGENIISDSQQIRSHFSFDDDDDDDNNNNNNNNNNNSISFTKVNNKSRNANYRISEK